MADLARIRLRNLKWLFLKLHGMTLAAIAADPESSEGFSLSQIGRGVADARTYQLRLVQV